MTDAEDLLARTVEELRAQLQAIVQENTALRVEIAQQKRWIGELRSTVAALMGAEPYPEFGKPTGKRRAA